jgi:pimeloyl-ACP methyl ester carboxylesterase
VRNFQKLVVIVGLVFSFVTGVHGPSPDSQAAGLGPGFTSGTAQVNGIDLHYVRGGSGPAILLVHGYPQDWTEYRGIMPELARRFTVVAVDLRGAGLSSAPPAGYDAPTMATDLHQLAQRLHLGKVYVVGHDIGGMVAYAYARLNPGDTRGTMVLDVPLPGLDPWQESTISLWHIGFLQTPDLPEGLMAGRLQVYFRFVLNKQHFTDADVDRYVRAYEGPARLHAGFEYYRNFPANGVFNAAQRGRITVPFVWAGGDDSVFGKFGPAIVASLHHQGWTDVRNATIADSDHFVVNDNPRAVIALIDRNATVPAHR